MPFQKVVPLDIRFPNGGSGGARYYPGHASCFNKNAYCFDKKNNNFNKNYNKHYVRVLSILINIELYRYA